MLQGVIRLLGLNGGTGKKVTVQGSGFRVQGSGFRGLEVNAEPVNAYVERIQR